MFKSKIKYIYSFILSIIIVFSSFGITGCNNDNENFNGNQKVDLANSEILVIYFSATNNTKRVAGYISDKLSANTLEIVPSTSYSSADLNWNNNSSRVNSEHNNRNNPSSPYYRPQFNKTIDSFDEYEIIFIGFPLWWQEAPNIIYTFLEEYSDELAYKTIIPFCTSTSSGIGESANHLHGLVSSSATWLDGQRFSSNVSNSTIEAWLNSLQK